MAISKKKLVINDNDDCFDADYSDDEEGEENDAHEQADESSDLKKIDKKKLIPGTLIVIRDLNARVGSNAVIAEPGLSDDGEIIWIKWAAETKVKSLPIGNLDSIVTTESRSRRSRQKPEFLAICPSTPRKKAKFNNDITKKRPSKVTPSPSKKKSSNSKKCAPSISKQKATSSPKQKATSSPKQKALPMSMSTSLSSISRPKLKQYHGLDIPILSNETDKKQYFLKFLFGDKVIVIENPLDGTKDRLDKSTYFNGVKYHLLFSKEKEVGIKSSIFEKMTNKRYVAYYVGGEGLKSASDVKRELEKLGDFSKLALEPGKICSRLELMVSPACKQYHGVYKMVADDFEQIEEKENVGCGFAPEAFFLNYFNAKIFAVQVRIFSAKLGWFKGVLMRKPFITKIQLPGSMLKVHKSTASDCSEEVNLLVNKIFPNAASKSIALSLSGKKVSMTALKNVKRLGAQFVNLLNFHGITMDEIDEYEDDFYEDGQLSRLRHDSNTCVGVADPTSSLPEDTVFVGGLKPLNCTDQVFITRYPCTEKKDGKLIKLAIGYRPENVSAEHWAFLQSLPFGILVFGPSSNHKLSLPEQISDGDLDGDLYHVLWDYNLVNKLKDINRDIEIDLSTPSSYYGPSGNDDSTDTMSPPSYYGPASTDDHNAELFDCRMKIGDKYESVTVVDNVNESSLKVQVGRGETQIMNKDEVKKDLFEYEIIGHEGSKIHVRFKTPGGNSGDERWGSIKDYKEQMPEAIADYALRHNLLSTKGWMWTRKHIRDTVMKAIDNHEGLGAEMKVNVKFDDGSIEEISVDEMKEDGPEILFRYASENNILQEWRDEYLTSSKQNWFEKAQDYNSRLKLLSDQSRLKSKLYEVYKKKLRENDLDAAEALSQAYKKALDLRKHACDIKLPYHLIGLIPKDLQVYVLND